MKFLVREADNVVTYAGGSDSVVAAVVGHREEVNKQEWADFNAEVAKAGSTGTVIWDAATRRAVARVVAGPAPLPQPELDRQTLTAFVASTAPTAADVAAAIKAAARLLGAARG